MTSGISSQILPSSTLPVFFLFKPPHCLKKKGILFIVHCSLMSSTHFSSIGRAPGPDSPPTMAQSILFSGSFSIGPSKGSSEMTYLHETNRSLNLQKQYEATSMNMVHSKPQDVALSESHFYIFQYPWIAAFSPSFRRNNFCIPLKSYYILL